jgi:alkylation response protein AidB-like acyl-CoA dehydrogenase
VAALAERSFTAAFVFWAQRAVIECLLLSPNRVLAQRMIPSLLDGTLAGVPGLSNGMKFLTGLEQLQTQFTAASDGVRLNGAIRWATNLRRRGFVVALAAGNTGTGDARVFIVPHHLEGMAREDDLDLIGLRGSNTAAVRLTDVALDDTFLVHSDAKAFLPQLRPAFLGLQCGLGLDLARASLRSVRKLVAGSGSVLLSDMFALEASVTDLWRALPATCGDVGLSCPPSELLRLPIGMVEIATAAVQLELQALGGRAYLRDNNTGFTRRSREAAFLPVVTPTLAQLKTDLAGIGGTS